MRRNSTRSRPLGAAFAVSGLRSFFLIFHLRHPDRLDDLLASAVQGLPLPADQSHLKERHLLLRLGRFTADDVDLSQPRILAGTKPPLNGFPCRACCWILPL